MWHSGRLDDRIVEEWRESKADQARRATAHVKDKSLERFPLGTEVDVSVLLSVAEGEDAADVEFLVDVRSFTCGRHSLFVQGPAEDPSTRLLLKSVPASAVLRAARHDESHDIRQAKADAFLKLFEAPAESLTTDALPVDELQRRVFSSACSCDVDDEEDIQRARSDDAVNVVMHMFRRLKSMGNMSDVAGTELEVLEKELARRHQARVFKSTMSFFSRHAFTLKAVVQDVSDRGEFGLRFEIEDLEGATTTVPGDSSYIQKHGECGDIGGGLFGANAGTVLAGGGLFGANFANTGGGLFGANTGGGLFGANTGGGLFGANTGAF